MNENRKIRTAIVVLSLFFVLVLLIFWIFRKGDNIISPIPPDSGIKIIFLSPTPESLTPTVIVEPEKDSNYN